VAVRRLEGAAMALDAIDQRHGEDRGRITATE